MLKHIKDIRSPIAVAQQKHAARKASSVITNDSTATGATVGHSKTPSQGRSVNRPPKLEVSDLSSGAPLTGVLSPQPGWPEPGIVSPSAETNKERAEEMAGPSTHMSTSTVMSTTSTLIGGSSNGADVSSGKSRNTTVNGNGSAEGGEMNSAGSSSREIPVASSSGVSYAVAIYPYMAEQDDEFDVVVCVSFRLSAITQKP